ncbi:DUF192 domain-containing protein [Natronomonas sp.]|uniref:DUF192 domain-containing protein n=1 Tax=Natronomonas sp. TaxID=2184060 RepID=UPI002FC29A5E
MNTRWVGYGVAAAAVVAALVLLGLSSGALAPYLGGYDAGADFNESRGYDHTEVAVYDGETEEELGRVNAAVADTFSKRYVGLSETDDLPADRGMLFIHDGAAERTYVMRNMSFGIDIVFVAPNGTITTIHEAPEPGPNEDGEEQRYSGTGKYVLEVNKGWMAERGIEEGDRIEFEL